MNGTVNILVVDDSDDAGMLAWALKRRGFENIVGADSGEAAIETCKRSRPDVLIMDTDMPGMQGYKAYGQMKELGCEPRLVYGMSGGNTKEYEKLWTRAGARRFFDKTSPGVWREIADAAVRDLDSL